MADRRVVSLNHRLRNLAEESGVAPDRLRHHYVFGRILARLAPRGAWFLKGGFALESRLGVAARATKDLDLLLAGTPRPTGPELQDLLDEALDEDLGDGMTFAVGAPKQLRAEDADPSAWRVKLVARLYGAEFATASLDVITATTVDPEEVDEVEVAGVLEAAAIAMPALDVDRQAAEKFHAYSRLYALDRPSSRVKDLVDLALLTGRGLLDPDRLRAALYRVFAERDGDTPPAALPAPPGNWAEPYARLATETELAETDVTAAWRTVAEYYQTVMNEESR